jgi:hypothetical protein
VQSSARNTLAQAAQSRVSIKIRAEMGALPWAAARLSAVAHRVTAHAAASSSLYTGIPPEAAAPVVGWLTAALLEYYHAFAHSAFRATRPGIGAFVAVMLSCMRLGMHDVSGIAIVAQNDIVRIHCPSPLDFPRLSPGLVTCKAMSSGRFALRTLAMSNTGHTRKDALFRPGNEQDITAAYLDSVGPPR